MDKLNKKKRNVKLIALFSIISIILIVLLGIFVVNYFHNKEEERILLEEKRKQEETHLKIVNHTKETFNFYLNNEQNEKSPFPVFNQVLEEQEKNKSINYENFQKNILKELNLSKLDNVLTKIDKEAEAYSLENLKLDLNLDDVDDSIYDKDTIKEIFDSNEFVKNKDAELTKRSEYLNKIDNLKSDFNSIKSVSKNFYKSGEKYLVKDDNTLNKLNEFAKKYNLKLSVEKEFLVPILCYHGVLDKPWGIESLFVRISEFESQMKYLSENGFTPLFASEISSAKNYQKPVIITFDDGYLDVYTNAFPILKKYNMKANVYMISDWIGGDVYMDAGMMREMSNSPLIEIGSHTVNHKGLATLSTEEIDYELRVSKEHLEEMLGKKINVIAYPKGSYDSRVVSAAKKYYTYGLSTNKGKENPNKLNQYTLNRIYVYRGTSLDTFKNIFN